MAQFNLKKFVNRKDVFGVINQVISTLGTAIQIEDINGNKLICAITEKSDQIDRLVIKQAVELAGEPIGYVTGENAKVEVIAALLSYLSKQEAEKKALANELLDKYQEFDLFQDIYTQITASLDLKEVAQLVTKESQKLLQSACSAIFLLNQDTSQLELFSFSGRSFSFQESLKFEQGIISTIVESGNGEIINNISSDPRSSHCDEGINSLICVPLKTKAQVIGAIAIVNDLLVTYTAGELKLLNMFALQAAVAIEKALLYEKRQLATLIAQDQAQKLRQTLSKLQQAQAQLIQSEKMSSLGQLVAGVAHEINNPLNFISGNLKCMHQYTQDLLHVLHVYENSYPQSLPQIQTEIEAVDLEFLVEDMPKTLASMSLGVERISQIVLSLRNFSRLDQAEMKSVNIHEGIDNTLLILQHRLKPTSVSSGIQIVKEYGNLPLVECYPGQLNQVFMNIISNAIDALDSCLDPHIISISTTVRNEQLYHKQVSQTSDYPTDCHSLALVEKMEAPTVVIKIRDNGTGMSEQVKNKLFDPFFTTKPVGKGTGLGLSISYQIVVEKHKGILQCFSQPGAGTEFVIEIPLITEHVNCLELTKTRNSVLVF